jgi:hypothetical protein
MSDHAGTRGTKDDVLPAMEHHHDGPRPDIVALSAILVVFVLALGLSLLGGGDGESATVAADGTASTHEGRPRLVVGSLAPQEDAVAESRLLAPVRYELSGSLPDLPREAEAFAMHDDGVGPDDVAELRDTLGLQGPVMNVSSAQPGYIQERRRRTSRTRTH